MFCEFEFTWSVNILVSDAPTWQAESAESALQYLVCKFFGPLWVLVEQLH